MRPRITIKVFSIIFFFLAGFLNSNKNVDIKFSVHDWIILKTQKTNKSYTRFKCK